MFKGMQSKNSVFLGLAMSPAFANVVISFGLGLHLQQDCSHASKSACGPTSGLTGDSLFMPAYLIQQVGPVHTGREGFAGFNAQQRLQVAADTLCGSGCEGNDGHFRELLLQHSQFLVVRPEVIAPLAAAMCFIYGNPV